LLYFFETIPVVIGLFRYNGERGVRRPNVPFLRIRRDLRGFSKRSCFICFHDEL